MKRFLESAHCLLAGAIALALAFFAGVALITIVRAAAKFAAWLVP